MSNKEIAAITGNPAFAAIIAAAVAQAVNPSAPKAQAPKAPAKPAVKASPKPMKTQAPAAKKPITAPGARSKARTDERAFTRTAAVTAQGEAITVGYDPTYGFGINLPGSKRMVFFHAAKWQSLASIAAAIPHVFNSIQEIMLEQASAPENSPATSAAWSEALAKLGEGSGEVAADDVSAAA